jgi:hypothetical protein
MAPYEPEPRTLSFGSRADVTRRAVAAFGGEEQGSHLSFDAELLSTLEAILFVEPLSPDQSGDIDGAGAAIS